METLKRFFRLRSNAVHPQSAESLFERWVEPGRKRRPALRRQGGCRRLNVILNPCYQGVDLRIRVPDNVVAAYRPPTPPAPKAKTAWRYNTEPLYSPSLGYRCTSEIHLNPTYTPTLGYRGSPAGGR